LASRSTARLQSRAWNRPKLYSTGSRIEWIRIPGRRGALTGMLREQPGRGERHAATVHGVRSEQGSPIYRFDSIVDRAPAVRYIVAVDLTLFLKHHVGIQEGPSLCARKLASDLESVEQREHTLTSEDLLAYVTARSEAEARKAAPEAGRPPPRSCSSRRLGNPPA